MTTEKAPSSGFAWWCFGVTFAFCVVVGFIASATTSNARDLAKRLRNANRKVMVQDAELRFLYGELGKQASEVRNRWQRIGAAFDYGE